MRRAVLGLYLISLAALSFAGSAQAHPGKTHIHELRASVSTANGVQWVNIKAKVCVRSSVEAGRVTPDELGLTQFFIYRGRWRPVRVLIDPAPQWLVALGENWGNKACGWVEFRDLFKHLEGFAFGSSLSCMGVAFSIKVAGTTATKRTTIKCGRK